MSTDEKKLCPTCGIDEEIALKRGEEPFSTETGLCQSCAHNPDRLLDGFLQVLGIKLDENQRGLALNRLVRLVYYVR